MFLGDEVDNSGNEAQKPIKHPIPIPKATKVQGIGPVFLEDKVDGASP